MKLFTKVMAAALLSTALTTASMAAVDLNDSTIIADDAKLSAVKPIVHVDGAGLDLNVTIAEELVQSLKAMPNDAARFTGNGGQVKNLMLALKAIYADLETVAGGEANLIGKIKGAATPLRAALKLDLAKAAGEWDSALNKTALDALRGAVVDDPFKTFDESALILDKLAVASLPASGGTKYKTIHDAIEAYERAKLDYATSKDKKDVDVAKEAMDELAAMKVATKNAGDKTVAEILAYETKKDWTTPEVRNAKAEAVKAVVKKTPEEEVAVNFFADLMTAIEGGAFAGITSLPQAAGLDLDDASNSFKTKANADKLLALLIAAGNDHKRLSLENAGLKSSGGGHGSGGDVGGGGHGGGVVKYSVTGLPVDIQELLAKGKGGWSFDSSTGIAKSGGKTLQSTVIE